MLMVCRSVGTVASVAAQRRPVAAEQPVVESGRRRVDGGGRATAALAGHQRRGGAGGRRRPDAGHRCGRRHQLAVAAVGPVLRRHAAHRLRRRRLGASLSLSPSSPFFLLLLPYSCCVS